MSLIPPESIQIDPIDVSTNWRILESSQSNRVKEDQCHKIERAAGVQVYFFALTLNPMGKTWCLEISDYAGGYAAKARCQSNLSTPSLSKPSFAIGSHSLRAYLLVREN